MREKNKAVSKRKKNASILYSAMLWEWIREPKCRAKRVTTSRLDYAARRLDEATRQQEEEIASEEAYAVMHIQCKTVLESRECKEYENICKKDKVALDAYNVMSDMHEEDEIASKEERAAHIKYDNALLRYELEIENRNPISNTTCEEWEFGDTTSDELKDAKMQYASASEWRMVTSNRYKIAREMFERNLQKIDAIDRRKESFCSRSGELLATRRKFHRAKEDFRLKCKECKAKYQTYKYAVELYTNLQFVSMKTINTECMKLGTKHENAVSMDMEWMNEFHLACAEYKEKVQEHNNAKKRCTAIMFVEKNGWGWVRIENMNMSETKNAFYSFSTAREEYKIASEKLQKLYETLHKTIWC